MPLRELSVALLLLLSDATAQATASPRGKVLGLVTDEAGAAVPGATVLLCSWPLPERIDLGSPDRVAVVAGDNGRFTAGVLDGRSYSVYATWRDALGMHVTALATDVVAGVPCLLRAAPPRGCTGIAVHGGDDWRRAGMLLVQLVVGDTNPIVRELALDRELRAEVPVDLPIGPTWIDVRASNGQLLRSMPLELAPATGRARIDIASAFTTTLAVEDSDGKRIAGAEVHVTHDHGYFGVATGRRVLAPDPIGRTGANGTLAVQLPAAHAIDGPGALRVGLLVTAAGHQRHIVDVVTAKAGPDDRVIARLCPGVDVRVRFVGRDGVPRTAGFLPLYESSAQVGSQGVFGGLVPLPPMPLRAAADGSFLGIGLHERAGLGAEASVRVFALVEPGQIASLGMSLPPDVGVPALLPIPLARAAQGGMVDLGDIPVAGFAAARFAVVDAHGAPVAGACLRLLGQGWFSTPSEYRADRVGRLALPLLAGTWSLGAFGPGGGVAVVRVTVPDDVGDRSFEVRLSAPRVVRGIVAKGAQALRPDQRVYVAPGAGIPIELAEVARACLEAVAIAADGSFAVRVPFGDAGWELSVATGTGSARTLGPRVLVSVGDADVDGVVLPMPQ